MRKFILCLTIFFRYVSGRPLNGQAYTDSSRHFFRRGTRALTPDGAASRWAMLAGWQRSAWRLCTPVALVLIVWAYRSTPTWTIAALIAVGSTLTCYFTVRAVRGWRRRNHTVIPLTKALSPVVEMTPAEITPRLVIEPTEIRVPIPDHYAGKVAQFKDIERIVVQRLGGEWDLAPNLKHHPFYLRFSPTPAPPGSIIFAEHPELLDAVHVGTQARPILGLGARSDLIHLDFDGEIAHMACSMGTGAGKSSFLRWITAQFAYHGVRSIKVHDTKWVSLAGMEDVPGLRIYRSIEEIWDSWAEERRIMDERYAIMLKNPSRQFPRRITIAEEMNAFAMESKLVWDQQKPKGAPKIPPVWFDIALMAVKARQVNMNIIGVWQRMSVDAAGGNGTLRDQFGLKFLSRFSPAAWDSLVATRPRAESSAVPGRGIAVMGGLQRQVQLPFITPEEALALATSGPDVTVTEPTYEQVSALPTVTVTPRYTLAEASREDWCPLSYDSLRQRKSRGKLDLPDGDRWTQAELETAMKGDNR